MTGKRTPETIKPFDPPRLNIVVIQNRDGSLEAWSNLKLACNYYEELSGQKYWTYDRIKQVRLPYRLKREEKTIFRLTINYQQTINDGEKF